MKTLKCSVKKSSFSDLIFFRDFPLKSLFFFPFPFIDEYKKSYGAFSASIFNIPFALPDRLLPFDLGQYVFSTGGATGRNNSYA